MYLVHDSKLMKLINNRKMCAAIWHLEWKYKVLPRLTWINLQTTTAECRKNTARTNTYTQRWSSAAAADSLRPQCLRAAASECRHLSSWKHFKILLISFFVKNFFFPSQKNVSPPFSCILAGGIVVFFLYWPNCLLSGNFHEHCLFIRRELKGTDNTKETGGSLAFWKIQIKRAEKDRVAEMLTTRAGLL